MRKELESLSALYIVCGIVSILIGSLAYDGQRNFSTIFPGAVFGSSLMQIIFGLVTFFIGITCILLSWRIVSQEQNDGILKTITVVIFIIFSLQVFLNIYSVSILPQCTQIGKSAESIKNPVFYKELLKAQEKLRCCGFNNYTDWFSIDKNTFPVSCCEKSKIVCTNEGHLYKKGCSEDTIYLCEYYLRIIVYISFFFVMTQLILFLISCLRSIDPGMKRSKTSGYEMVRLFHDND